VTEDAWRGTLNQILYLANHAHDLSDDDAAAFAERMIQHDFFPDGPAVYRAAIDAALADPVLLGEEAVPQPHAEPVVREFLGKLATALDERQPWAAPRYVMLDVSQWETFGQARAIARIDWSAVRVGNFLRSMFRGVPVGERSLPVLVFRIGSGETLALIGSTEPGVHNVTLLQRDPGDPAAVIDHFREYTGFSEQDVTPL